MVGVLAKVCWRSMLGGGPALGLWWLVILLGEGLWQKGDERVGECRWALFHLTTAIAPETMEHLWTYRPIFMIARNIFIFFHRSSGASGVAQRKPSELRIKFSAFHKFEAFLEQIRGLLKHIVCLKLIPSSKYILIQSLLQILSRKKSHSRPNSQSY